MYDKSANYIRDLRKTAEDKEAHAKEADYAVSRAFCSILEKLAKAPEYRTSFEELESQAYSTYGERAVPYIDLLYKTSHLQEPRGKHDANYKMFTPSQELNMFSTFLKQAETLGTTVKEAEDAKHNYQCEKTYIDDTFKQRGCELHKISNNQIDGSFLAKLEEQMKKEAKEIEAINEEDPVMASIKQKKANELKKEDERIKKIAGLIDAALDKGPSYLQGERKPSLTSTTNSASDNRQRVFLLQELATTDPILAKLPTHKVVDAYQQMLRVSPELSKEKEIVRSFLRSSTAGQAIDPYVGGQLIDANTKLLKQHKMELGLPSGGDRKED